MLKFHYNNNYVVPSSLTHGDMKISHESLRVDHVGISKTKDRVQNDFSWP